MVTPIGAGLIAAGLVMLFVGAVLSLYGVSLLGAVVGGAAGFLVAQEIGFTATMELAGALGAGAIAGVLISYLLISLAVAVFGFIVGLYFGAGLANWLLDPNLIVVAAAALATGILAAALSTILKRTIMVVVTSFAGAALASQSVTAADFGDAGLTEPDPILFDLNDPLFLGLFALGILTQLGLFRLGYVTSILAYLPGASMLRDRED